MEQLQEDLIKFFRLGDQLEEFKRLPVPTITSATQLSDDSILAQFRSTVEKIISRDMQEVALLGRHLLEDVLLPGYVDFKNVAPEKYNEYLRLVALLKFVNLSVQPFVDIDALLQNYLFTALEEGINVRRKLQDILDSYDDIMLDGQIAEELSRSFTGNKALLGSVPILLPGQNRGVEPTIANWLKDYLSFRRYSTYIEEREAVSFNRIAYFNNNANAKKLSAKDRPLLLAVLKLYDWLRFGDEAIDIWEEIYPKRSIVIAELEKEVAKLETGSGLDGLSPATGSAPGVSIPQGQPQITHNGELRPPTSPPTPPLPHERFNIQDVLNPKNNLGVKAPSTGQGVSLSGQNSGIDIQALAKEAREKRASEDAEISQKLEDLKKRKPKIN